MTAIEGLKKIQSARLDWGMGCECVCPECRYFDKIVREVLSEVLDVKPALEPGVGKDGA